MNNHYLQIALDGGPHVEFECKASESADCRRRPVDPDVEEWDINTQLDDGGHVCWVKQWVEDTSIEEAFSVHEYVPEVIAQVPIEVGYFDGPFIVRVGQY